jgi:hypothetical protein
MRLSLNKSLFAKNKPHHATNLGSGEACSQVGDARRRQARETRPGIPCASVAILR